MVTAATRSKMSPASWSSAPTAHPLSKHTRRPSRATAPATSAPPTSATHGQNYTFTVTQAANYDYAVAVTVNGLPVTCTVNSSGSNAYTYTIPAKSVTGPVVITVKKAPQSGTTQIVLTGSGSADVWGDVTSYTVKSGEAFTFGINHRDGFDYTVIVMVGEKTLTLQRNENASTYTIPETTSRAALSW